MSGTNSQACFSAAVAQQYMQRYGGGSGTTTSGAPSDVSQQQTKHARRLYVGGIPPGTTEEELGAFFGETIAKANMATRDDIPGPAIVQVYINHEKCFAFVELKSVDLTTACMGFDGVKYPHRAGMSILRVRRPNDYKPEQVAGARTGASMNLAQLGIIGTTVSDGPAKVFVGGLPYHLQDDDVKELLSAFGPLKSFHLVKEGGSTNSKGYAFCEYFDQKITQEAISGLNNMAIGDKTLTVRIATQGQQAGAMGAVVPYSMTSPSVTQGLYGGGAPIAVTGIAHLNPTRVLKLSNMVDEAEISDDQEYREIAEDVRGECSGHGAVVAVLIPRAKEGFPKSSEGSIYVEFRDPSGARNAALALYGRKFAERTVVVEYFDEEEFQSRRL